jgi:hypothetical protein
MTYVYIYDKNGDSILQKFKAIPEKCNKLKTNHENKKPELEAVLVYFDVSTTSERN